MRSYLVATWTWPEVLVGEIELLDAERAAILLAGRTNKQYCCGDEDGGIAAMTADGGRGEFEVLSLGTDQVSSSSSMNVSCGAMVTIVWSAMWGGRISMCVDEV